MTRILQLAVRMAKVATAQPVVHHEALEALDITEEVKANAEDRHLGKMEILMETTTSKCPK